MSRAPKPIAVLLVLLAGSLSAWSCGPNGEEGQSNSPPEISLNVGSQEEYVVGEDVIRIRVTATDPDGDALSFSVVNTAERAELTAFEQEALFEWDPITSDVTMGEPRRLTFVVEDEHGERAEQDVRIEIKPGNGKQRFLNSASELHDVSSDEPVEFEVEVRDDDSQQVDISMPSADAPQGASFMKTGEMTGLFEWDPTPIQEKKRVHSVTFVADDMDNQKVEHEVTIIFKNRKDDVDTKAPQKNQPDCDREKPIEFTPIPAQHTLENYGIEARFSAKAADKYDRVSVLWTTQDPLNSQDVDYESEEMTIEGRKLTGSIPNLQLAAGKSEVVFYAICALDEDAPQEADEKFVCSPDRGFHSFIAYSPDDEQCIDDDENIGAQSKAAPVSESKWRHFRSCQGAADFHQFQVGPGETGDVFVSFPRGQTIDFEVLDEQMNPVEDALTLSPCTGLALVEITHGSSQSKATYYIRVTGEEIPYQTLLTRTGASGQCSEDDREPNDAVEDATPVVDNKTLSSMSICKKDDRDLFVFEMLKGDEFSSTVNFKHADGDLDATLFSPSQESQIAPQANGVARSWSKDDDEQLSHKATATGLYHLLVYSNDATNDYSVSFETTCVDGDQFQGNDSRKKASVVSLKSYSGLKLCAGESDWYERTGFMGTNLSADLNVETGAKVSDVSITVYDEAGKKVTESVKITDKQVVDFSPSSNQQYFFEVTSPKKILYGITFEQR